MKRSREDDGSSITRRCADDGRLIEASLADENGLGRSDKIDQQPVWVLRKIDYKVGMCFIIGIVAHLGTCTFLVT